MLSILTCAVLITGNMSSNAFANPVNDILDERISQSEIFESNDKYNLNIDIHTNSYYRVISTNYIINNGVKTSKTSISNSIYMN